MKIKRQTPKKWRCHCGKRKQRKGNVQCAECGRRAAALLNIDPNH